VAKSRRARRWLGGALLAALLAAASMPAARAAAPGDAAAARGDYESAIEDYGAMLAARDLPDEQRVSLLAARAEAWQRLGFAPESIRDLEAALALAPARVPARESELRAMLGAAYLIGGNPVRAEQELHAAAGLARGADETRSLAAISVDLGMLHAMGPGAHPEAEAELEVAAGAAEAAGDPLLAARAAVGAGRLALARGDGAAAGRLLATAAKDLRQSPPSHDKAYTLIAAAELARSLDRRLRRSSGDDDRLAFDALTEAARWAAAQGDRRALSYAWGDLAELYGDRGRAAEARELTERALAALAGLRAPEIAYRWHWRQGRLLEAAGDSEGAIAAYRSAVAELQEIRSDLSLASLGARVSFRDAVGPVFLELADLLLRRPPGARLPQARLIEARQIVETLKGAELQDYFEDDCVASLQARAKPIDRLAPHTAALYPILLRDRIELLLSIGDGIEQVTVPVAGERVRETAATLRRLLEKRTTNEYLIPAHALYSWLIRPLEGALSASEIDTLVVVPDGPLLAIPFAALNDGEHFLIERYALAVTPGLTLVDPRPLPRESVAVLAGGITEAVQGFAPLPEVQEEMAAIRSLYGAEPLENAAFRSGRLEAALRRGSYTIVHLASHGVFLADARRSFILTFDGRLTMDELETMMKYGRFRARPVELLTLSACSTAAGDERAALGLAGVAVKAGARGALATLWSVSDRSSAELVAEFYRRLGDPKASKAAALQGAQRILLHDPRYRHPYYWAPFLLIGNWL